MRLDDSREGVLGKDIAVAGCVQKGDPGPDSNSTGFLGSMAKQGEGSKVFYGLLKCKGIFGG